MAREQGTNVFHSEKLREEEKKENKELYKESGLTKKIPQDLLVPLFEPEKDDEQANLLWGFPDKQRDRLLGILEETPDNREHLLDLVGKGLKQGEHFAILYVDTDFLKWWNENENHGRFWGDKAIQHSTFTAAQELRKLFPNNDIVAIRASTAADETMICILGLDKNQLGNIKKLREELGIYPEKESPKDQSLPVGLKLKSKDIDIRFLYRKFSFSADLVYSAEEKYTDFFEDTKSKLKLEKKEDGIEKPYGFFNTLLEDVKNRTDKIKVGKLEELLGGLESLKLKNKDDYIAIAAYFCGDMRLGQNGLARLLEFIGEKNIKDFLEKLALVLQNDLSKNFLKACEEGITEAIDVAKIVKALIEQHEKLIRIVAAEKMAELGSINNFMRILEEILKTAKERFLREEKA